MDTAPQKENLKEAAEQRVKSSSVKEIAKHGVFALVIGVVAAAASMILCLCVNGAYHVFTTYPVLLWCLPLFGLASLGLYKWWKLPLDLSTHHVIVKMRHNEPISKFLAPGILLGTCATIFGGGSVGKEAAVLQMGASLGSLVSRPFHLRSIFKTNKNESMEGYAAATGMAAAFAALFFAPIGSAIFVLELSRLKNSIAKHSLTILVACFVAYGIASAFGIGDVIDKVAIPEASWPVVGQCLIVGLGATVFGSLFATIVESIHALTKRISKNYFLWVIIGGLLFACLVTAFGWMDLTGSGGDNLNRALHGSYGSWDFAIKLLLTSICLGFWFKGGEIMPSFCIGGLLGASCTALSGGDPAFGAALGAITFFGAFSGCPLAAFVMGLEIFGLAAAPWLAITMVVTHLMKLSVNMYGALTNEMVRARWRSIFKGSRQRYEKRQSEVNRLNQVNTPGLITEAEDAVEAFGQTFKTAEETLEASEPSSNTASQDSKKVDKNGA